MLEARNRLWLVATALLGCLIGGLVGAREFRPAPVSVDTPAPASTTASTNEVGRYQLTRMDDNSVYLLDTKTGRVWYRYGSGTAEWEDQSASFAVGK